MGVVWELALGGLPIAVDLVEEAGDVVWRRHIGGGGTQALGLAGVLRAALAWTWLPSVRREARWNSAASAVAANPAIRRRDDVGIRPA